MTVYPQPLGLETGRFLPPNSSLSEGTSSTHVAFNTLQRSLARVAPAPKAYVGLFKDNAVAVLDTATNHILSTIPVPAGPHGIVITPDGRWVYISSDGASTVSVIDTRTDTVSDSIEVGQTPHGLAITPNGGTVLVTGGIHHARRRQGRHDAPLDGHDL